MTRAEVSFQVAGALAREERFRGTAIDVVAKARTRTTWDVAEPWRVEAHDDTYLRLARSFRPRLSRLIGLRCE